MRRHLVIAIVIIAVVYAAKQLIPVFDGKMQFDFRTYYYAALAYEKGMDPYNLQSLRDLSGRGIIMTFIYPPHCLFIFKPLALLGYSAAYFTFFAAKLFAFGLLIWIWTMVVPAPGRDLWAVLVTGLLGYQGAALRDIIAGNLSIFEQVLIWGGICLLLRSRTILGGVILLLSSVVKLLTVALGPLIFMIGRSRKYFFVWLVLTVSFCLVYLAAYAAQPELWKSFISSTVAASFYEKGHLNPSSLAFLKAMAGRLGLGAAPARAAYAVWCILVVCVLIWAFRATIRYRDRYPILYAYILAYVIVSPKMKDYSTLIAALPTLHTISAILPNRYRLIACALLWIPLFGYQPLILAVGTFIALLAWIYANRDNPEAKMEPTLDPLRGIFRLKEKQAEG